MRFFSIVRFFACHPSLSLVTPPNEFGANAIRGVHPRLPRPISCAACPIPTMIMLKSIANLYTETVSVTLDRTDSKRSIILIPIDLLWGQGSYVESFHDLRCRREGRLWYKGTRIETRLVEGSNGSL